VTRLLREHPEIGVEVDEEGRLVAIAWMYSLSGMSVMSL